MAADAPLTAYEWQAPPDAVPYDPVSYLCGNAAVRPRALAVMDPQRELSFAELSTLVAAAAEALTGLGVSRGEPVGLHLANYWEFVVLELAIPYAGGIVLPLPPSLAAREMEWALSRTGAKLVLGSTELEPLRGLPPKVRALNAATVCDGPGTGLERPGDADPDRIVEIALTSGTTGLPKLASLSARLKQATFEGFTRRLEIGAGDRVLIMSPVAHGLGGMCLFGSRLGAAMVMLRRSHFDPEYTLSLAAETGATHLVGVPTNVIRMLSSAALDRTDLSAARVTAVAGSLMPAEVAREWEERTASRVCIFYGSMDAGQLAVASPRDPAPRRWESVGRPHDASEAKIAAPDGRSLPSGEVGEVCMRGDTVQTQYWGEDYGPCTADGFAHMGDLGFIDPEGYLHIVGRLADTIIRGGANINPVEVENLLRSHPAVAEVCVVGRADPELGERVVAFVTLQPGASLGLEDLRPWLAEAGLARYKWPEMMQLLPELPLSGPGKVSRVRLRQLAETELAGKGS